MEGVYLHSLLSLATVPERSCFPLYLGIGWGEWAGVRGSGVRAGSPGPRDQSCSLPATGAPMLFVIPWAVVKCLFENIQ